MAPRARPDTLGTTPEVSTLTIRSGSSGNLADGGKGSPHAPRRGATNGAVRALSDTLVRTHLATPRPRAVPRARARSEALQLEAACRQIGRCRLTLARRATIRHAWDLPKASDVNLLLGIFGQSSERWKRCTPTPIAEVSRGGCDIANRARRPNTDRLGSQPGQGQRLSEAIKGSIRHPPEHSRSGQQAGR